MSKHKDNEATKEIKNHLIESDKILKQLIANVFEFAKGEPVTVHVIGNPSQKGVKIEVISIVENKEVLLVRQLRFGTGEMSLELPGGLMDEGEDQLDGIKRELQEETGFTSASWRYLTSVASNPVFMNNYIHTWVARNVQLTSNLNLDDAEDIEIIKVTIPKLKELLIQGAFTHPHAISAVTIFLLKSFF